MQPLYVEADEWDRSLNSIQDAYGFESALNTYLQGFQMGMPSPLTGEALSENQRVEAARDGTHIFAPGDGRIWHRKVEDWVSHHLPCESPQFSPIEQEGTELPQSTTKNHANLVEALMGHGILREHDLRVLSATESIPDNLGYNETFSNTFSMAAESRDGNHSNLEGVDIALEKWTTLCESVQDMDFDGEEINHLPSSPSLVAPLDTLIYSDIVSLIVDEEAMTEL
jgi:hypothetical protein